MNLLQSFWNPLAIIKKFTLWGGGSGGGGGPTTSTTQTSNIPEYARPYVETMLGATQQQLFNTAPGPDGTTQITSVKPYQAFGAPVEGSQYGAGLGPNEMAAARSAYAGYDPLQTTAYQGVAGLQMPGQFGDASNAAAQATNQALGARYRAGQFGNQFQAPGQYVPGQFSMTQAEAPSLQDYQMQAPADVQAQQLQQYQMGPSERVGTQSYTGENVGQYMSPYMQNVVDIQKREAQRASDIAGTQQAGQAVKMGAFGGSRAGLLEAERQRNLATQMGDIQATGQQAAFQNAQQQFNAQQQANLQAALANQQAGLTTGQQNLAAQLGVQQLGAGQNLQAALANQQAGLTTGQQNLAARLGTQQLGAGQNLQAQLANQQALQAAQQAAEQSRQFGYGQRMTGAQLGAQYGLAGQQLGEQSRQFGANLGLQGAQAGIQGAGMLGNLGQQQLAAQQGIYGLQNQFGAQRQAYDQNVLNQAIQNYAMQQQYPQQQLAFMNAQLRGLPMQASTTQGYQAPPSYLSQAAGLGMAGYGLSRLAGKKGGLPKDFEKKKDDAPGGLQALALSKM